MPASRRSLTYLFIGAAVIVVAALLYRNFPSQSAKTAQTGQLFQAVANYKAHSSDRANTISSDPNQAAEIQGDGQTVLWFAADGTRYTTTASSGDAVSKEFADNNYFNFKVDSGSGSNFLLSVILPNLILFGLMALILLWIFRQTQSGNNQAMSFGRSRARLLAGDKPAITFADVAGVDEAKQELNEIVEFLKFPDKFAAVGARIPKGVLLVGPPGTGKTLLSKAVAGEAGVPFFSISGSEFVEMFVGVGASRVRDLFDQAKKNSPCIVFVDEIDAVGRQRGAGLGGGHDEREQTLNQLLVEMDGFETATHVIVIAATNRPDVLDPALLRPGRFDRHVMLDRPDIRGRRAILEVHARNKPLDSGVDLEVLAKQTPGFSGADLSNLINEAAILAARFNRKVITMNDLEESIARVIAGPERRSRMITEKEKTTIAFHEMGHALVGKTLEHTDPVHKVTIVSRGMALGWTMSLPTEDRYLVSKAELIDQLAQILGGRCSEELIFGEDNITTGASDDIRKATNLARKMVTEWGMSDKLGPLTFGERQEMVFLGRDLGEQRNYSEDIASEIDQEVHQLVADAFLRAKQVLREREVVLRALASRLVEVETMDAAEMDRIIIAAESGAIVDGANGSEPPAEAAAGA
ncbi:MAG TPA: ATP-dependent zinc metalloprotease FtsH [Candidatus Acidoferrales bacterium]|jgi:cell division protease FtsH|nr:ATP-dependent zinc metalloprotease FtsH [Candidatus Acidoferrales bacterium]